MKLKYYLRGLGIGVLVTALILSIAPGKKESLTDAEIRERALALGMVDSRTLTLADVQGALGATSSEEETPSKGGEQQESSEKEPTEESSEKEPTEESTEKEPTQESTENKSVQESTEKEPMQENTESNSEQGTTEMVTIVVESGFSSYTVSETLADAGLIADAKAFDAYLCDNGYSRSIHVGTYEIARGTSMEEIAKIILGKH